jgi:hypothetical protein
MHGPALVRGHADGGVELVRLFLGFGTLGEDAFGKEEVFSDFRKHLIDVNVGFLDHLIQFYCKRVHALFLSDTKYAVRLEKLQTEAFLISQPTLVLSREKDKGRESMVIRKSLRAAQLARLPVRF